MVQESSTPAAHASPQSIVDECLVRYDAGADAARVVREAALSFQRHVSARLVARSFTRIADMLSSRPPDTRGVYIAAHQLVGAELRGGADVVLLRAMVYSAVASADEVALRSATLRAEKMLLEPPHPDEDEAAAARRRAALLDLMRCAQRDFDGGTQAVADDVRRCWLQPAVVVADLRRFAQAPRMLPARKRGAQAPEGGDGSAPKRARGRRDGSGSGSPIPVEYEQPPSPDCEAQAPRHQRSYAQHISSFAPQSAPSLRSGEKKAQPAVVESKSVDTESESSQVTTHSDVQPAQPHPSAAPTDRPAARSMHQTASSCKPHSARQLQDSRLDAAPRLSPAVVAARQALSIRKQADAPKARSRASAAPSNRPAVSSMHQLVSIRKHVKPDAEESAETPKPVLIAHSRGEDPRRSLLRRPKRGDKRPTRKWCHYCSLERARTNGKRRGYIETYCSRCFVNVCEKHWHADDGHQAAMCEAVPPPPEYCN